MSIIRALFFLLAAVNLTAEFYQQELLIYLTKPLLVSTLAVYFLLKTHARRGTAERFLVYGLFFSILGDTLLMFVENGAGNDLLFALGLGSFLLTHVFYSLAFNTYQSIKSGYLRREKWWILPFFTYLFVNTFILFPAVPPDLQIPVVVYSCAITLMAVSVFNLKNSFPAEGFPWLLAAGLLFVFSDTIIGWNKFKTDTVSIPQARLWIMIPYLASQYLLVTTWTEYARPKVD